eukprot:gene2704-23034_t
MPVSATARGGGDAVDELHTGVRVSFTDVREGMVVSMVPSPLGKHSFTSRYACTVLWKGPGKVLVRWASAEEGGPPAELGEDEGGAPVPRERDESEEWWDGGGLGEPTTYAIATVTEVCAFAADVAARLRVAPELVRDVELDPKAAGPAGARTRTVRFTVALASVMDRDADTGEWRLGPRRNVAAYPLSASRPQTRRARSLCQSCSSFGGCARRPNPFASGASCFVSRCFTFGTSFRAAAFSTSVGGVLSL